MMRTELKIFIVTIFFVTVVLAETPKSDKDDLYSIKLTGIHCSNIDPKYFTNVSCKLRAVRGRQGVLNLFFVYNNIPKLTTAYQLYYRNTSGRYMLYIINIWIDYCKIMSDNMGLQSKLTKLLLGLWYKFDTAIKNGCPMNGVANYTDFEVDQIKHFIFPSIIPAGDYAFYIRNYETDTNRSLGEIRVQVNVKGKSGSTMQLSMLNMG